MSSSSCFVIKEHILEAQHIREYPRATAISQEDVLRLSIKQYTPLDNQQPREGDITIIATHANGFPKELYEPLWEDIYARSKSNGFNIRGIWIADLANQGRSGLLNESILGNDPSWVDHSRDLLHMINHFRAEMPMPIVGLGHSFGGTILCNLAFMHPRLLSTIILLDPVIQKEAFASGGGPSPARLSTFRRDIWPSREEAESSFRKQKFYQAWDPRVLDRWCKYGIRETPTALYPDAKGAVTLSTTKQQECYTFLRPSWDGISPDEKTILRQDLIPDMSPDVIIKYPLYRAEPANTLNRLKELRPSAFYIFGGDSFMSQPEAINLKIETTGTGVGGSGGAKVGRVKAVTLDGVGHLVAMEATDKCAYHAATWLGQEVRRFEEEREKYAEWARQSSASKTAFSEDWKHYVGGPLKKPPSKSKI